MRDMVARYTAVAMLAKKTTAYPQKSNDKSRAPAINAPRTINPTLITCLDFSVSDEIRNKEFQIEDIKTFSSLRK